MSNEKIDLSRDRDQIRTAFYQEFPKLYELQMTSPVVKSCIEAYISGAWTKNEALEQCISHLHKLSVSTLSHLNELLQLTGPYAEYVKYGRYQPTGKQTGLIGIDNANEKHYLMRKLDPNNKNHNPE